MGFANENEIMYGEVIRDTKDLIFKEMEKN